MKKLVCLCVLLACGVHSAFAVRTAPKESRTVTGSSVTSGTLALTEKTYGDTKPTLHVVTFTWTADASTSNVTATIPDLWGTIERVVTDPDGTDVPADNYDITLTDENGIDLLCGLGANRDTANTESFVPLVGNGTGVYGATSPGGTRPVLMAGGTTLSITNATNSKAGVLKLYLRREY